MASYMVIRALCLCPRQAVVLLRKLHLITGHDMLVFPGKRTSERPISDRLCVQRFCPWATGRPCRWFMASATARATLAEVVEIDPSMKQAELTHAAMDANGGAHSRTQYLRQCGVLSSSGLSGGASHQSEFSSHCVKSRPMGTVSVWPSRSPLAHSVSPDVARRRDAA